MKKKRKICNTNKLELKSKQKSLRISRETWLKSVDEKTKTVFVEVEIC